MAVRVNASTDDILYTAGTIGEGLFTAVMGYYISVDRNDYTNIFWIGQDSYGDDGAVDVFLDGGDGVSISGGIRNYNTPQANAVEALAVGEWYDLAITGSTATAQAFSLLVRRRSTGTTNVYNRTSGTLGTWPAGAGGKIQLMMTSAGSGNVWSNGRCQNFKIWDGAALTADQIAWEWRYLHPVFARSQCYAAWPMQHATDTRDLSSNGRSPTLTGLQTEDGVPLRWAAGARRSARSQGGAAGITGSVNATLGAATAVGAGTVDVAGSVNRTLGAATADADGTVDVAGSVTRTLDAAALDADGAVSVQGSVNRTLDAATLDADATTDTEVTGSVNATLGDATADATGTVAIAGTVARTLDAATLDAEGVAGSITGVLNKTLDDATLRAFDTPPATQRLGGDDAPPRGHRGWDRKSARLKLNKDRQFEASIRDAYRALIADPITRERAEELIAPTIVERNDESPRQYAARLAARASALRADRLRLDRITAETEIALRLLYRELQEMQERDDEDVIGQLLAQVL